MSTISVPLDKRLEAELDRLVAEEAGSSRADVMRQALRRFAEQRAIQDVLDASREPSLRGDLRALSKKLARA
ncbi:ribbon-helix-helix protein, CopG family [Candidatus Kaiserbacteria bacterium]|nr:ribbon-helix-helix protein, CopG family [Candidatus Kaiserbacteria bacterium]